MSEVDRQLRLATKHGLDPEIVSPRGTWFAWRPVPLSYPRGKWAWLRRVRYFRPLGLLTEYYEIEDVAALTPHE